MPRADLSNYRQPHRIQIIFVVRRIHPFPIEWSDSHLHSFVSIIVILVRLAEFASKRLAILAKMTTFNERYYNRCASASWDL